ncbi:MAG: tetratricopeptide repeat protein [Bacteroidales bacterium]|nr:tetratricopeptide repeat protein [Bacteroidales bacterium]
MKRFCLNIVLALLAVLPLQAQTVLSEADQRRFDYYYMESVNSKLRQDYTSAYLMLEHCLAIDSTSAAAYYELSQYYLMLGQTPKGTEALEKAVEYGPDNYWYGQGLANLYLQQGEESKALALIEQMAERFPTHVELLFTLESLYSRAENYDKVIEVLNTLEQKRGKSEPLTMEKYRIYRQMGDEKRAFKELEGLIEEYPNELRYQVALGDAYLQTGKQEKAYDIYNEVLKQEPDNANALYSLASYYELTDKTALYEQTLDSLLLNRKVEDAVKVNVMRRLMVQVEQEQRDSTEIIRRFDRILEQDTENADLTMLYAQYLIAKNMNKEAKPVLRKLLQIDPTNSGGRMTLLQDAIREEDYNAIIDLCEGGVEASPEALEFYYYLSIGYAHEQRHDDVIRVCKQALEHVNENSTKEIVSDFYSMMGDTYHTQGNMTEAYQAYEKAIETYGNNVGALNNYAYYLSLEKRDLDKAEEMSYKTVKAEPENGTYLDTYAWILFVKGNYTQAKLYIDMAMKADGDKSADVVEHCGDIYYMVGETAAAVEYWKQALELGSQSAKLKQKINQKKYVE